MIAIIVCDSNEIKNLKINIIKINEIGTFKFIETMINKKEVVIVLSGIGLIQSAAATQSLFENYKKIEVIYNFGAVGGFNKNKKIYDIILPRKIFYSDVDTPWYEYGQLPHQPPFFNNFLDNHKYNFDNIASSMGFQDSLEKIEKVQKMINVQIFDMEVAAIANISKNWNVPIGVVKCVSDLIGIKDISDKETINKRIKIAGEKAFNVLKSLI